MTTRRKRQPIQTFGLGQSCCDWRVPETTEFVGAFDYSDENAAYLRELRFSGTRRLVFDKIMGSENDVPEPAFATFTTGARTGDGPLSAPVPRVVNREETSAYSISTQENGATVKKWKLWGNTSASIVGQDRILAFLLGERAENGAYTNDYVEKFGRYLGNVNASSVYRTQPFANYAVYPFAFDAEPSETTATRDETAGTASEVYVFTRLQAVNYRIALVYNVESLYGNGAFKDATNYGTTFSGVNSTMFWNGSGDAFSIVDSIPTDATFDLPDSIGETTVGGVALTFPRSATATVSVAHTTPTISYGYRNGFVLDGGKTETKINVSFGLRLASSLTRSQLSSVDAATEARVALAESVAPFFENAAAEIVAEYSNKLRFNGTRCVQFLRGANSD